MSDHRIDRTSQPMKGEIRMKEFILGDNLDAH